MSSPIEVLRQSLNKTLAQLVPSGYRLPDDGIKAIQKIVSSLRKQLGDRPVTPPPDRICSALKTLRTQGPRGLDGMSFYFACWGLTQQCAGHAPLIEDDRPFADFMGEAEHRKPASLLWLGLLDAYFRYDPETSPAGKADWQRLRTWLENDLDSLLRRTNPSLLACLAWLNTLARERGLLSESNPVKPYAAEVLQGKQERLDRIKADLDIPPTSWFWRELVLAQIKQAVTFPDDDFKTHLQPLISLLREDKIRENEVLRDDGLKHLLTRYHACQDHSTHESLKALALEAWQSPQISSHGKWGHVTPAVKEMVSQWLVLEDLQDFFELLAADRAADPRRLHFWARYIKQISFSHIALGNHLWNSHDRDWVEFKQKKKGRISRLDGGGGNKNAFIMKIGAYYFVEFGEMGDACYGYPESNVPFTLGRGYLEYPGNLRDKQKGIFRGIHRDGRVRWEQRFVDGSDTSHGLRDLGITMAAGVAKSRSQTATRLSADAERDMPVFTAPRNAVERPSALDSIRTEDRRRSGGALWVFHLDSHGDIAEYLKAQGYRHAIGKGWWKQ